MIFDAAEKIIIVPGYGLAVAQAQHAVKVAEFLENSNKSILCYSSGCRKNAGPWWYIAETKICSCFFKIFGETKLDEGLALFALVLGGCK